MLRSRSSAIVHARLTSRLDYLNDGDPTTTIDLGIDGIWLMPITQSPSHHGYDPVDDEYGTEEGFLEFLAQAEERGIRVVMDLVVNHCSHQHPWFRQANESVDSPFHDWFVWRPTRSPSSRWRRTDRRRGG